jgi:hypothetical protein
MQIGRFIPIAVLAAFAVGCSTAGKKAEMALDSPITVKTRTDPDSDFSKYRTWSFVPLKAGAPVDPRLDDPMLTAAFDDAVEGQMFTRGYRRVEIADGPDLLVNVHATIDRVDAAYIQEYYEGSYAPEYRTDVGGKKLAEEWEEGAIIIILFDSRTMHAVWGASAQAEAYQGLDVDTRRRRVEKGVALMMESLPARQ